MGCGGANWTFSWYLVGGIAVAWLAYEGAVWRAVAWGDLIKSAFDLYLPSLARTLGYTLPNTQEKRREFWKEFSMMALYFEPMDPAKYPAAADEAAESKSENAPQGGGNQKDEDSTEGEDD